MGWVFLLFFALHQLLESKKYFRKTRSFCYKYIGILSDLSRGFIELYFREWVWQAPKTTKPFVECWNIVVDNTWTFLSTFISLRTPFVRRQPRLTTVLIFIKYHFNFESYFWAKDKGFRTLFCLSKIMVRSCQMSANLLRSCIWETTTLSGYF